MDMDISDLLGLGKASDKTLELVKEAKDTLEKIVGPIAGPAWSELGQSLSDPIRRMRIQRELKWSQSLTLAAKYVDMSGKEYKYIDLKTLYKLMESSSLEENNFLQDKWARLIATAIVQGELPPSCISILGELSPSEARILDFMYREINGIEKDKNSNVFNSEFDCKILQEIDSLPDNKLKSSIDNLVRLNLCEMHDTIEAKSVGQRSLREKMRIKNALLSKKTNLDIAEFIANMPVESANIEYNQTRKYRNISLTNLGFECVQLWDGPENKNE
jgi:hypothetical protein